MIEEVKKSFEEWKPDFEAIKKTHHFMTFKAGYEKALEDLKLFLIDNVIDWNDDIEKIYQYLKDYDKEEKGEVENGEF